MVDVCFHALVIEVSSLVSKAGNPYGVISFLDLNESDMYRIYLFGEEANASLVGISKGLECDLDFIVKPDRTGGVRLELAGVRNAKFKGHGEGV